MNEKTAKFNTLCRDCIFAQFNEEHTLQIGCELNRLEKFQLKNKASLVKDKETDLEYYSIETICNTCRDNTNKYSNPIKEVKKEIELKFDYIILADSNREDWEEQVIKTAASFLSHTILPKKVIFGFYKKKILFHSFDSKIKKIFAGYNISYDIVNILEDVYDSWKLIDILVKKSKSQYFTLFEIDGRLPDGWIDKINISINEELNNISMIEPVAGLTGLTIQKFLFSTLNGSEGINVLDKIKNLAIQQNLESMVRQWDEL